MEYARDALFGPAKALPAWYPRELLGTPFWSKHTELPIYTDPVIGVVDDGAQRATYVWKCGYSVSAARSAVHLFVAMATVRPIVSRAVVLLLLLVHVIDLGVHDRRFILPGSLGMPAREAEIITRTLEEVGDGRVAIDYALALPMARTVDDIGFFDSIMLDRPYRLILDLSGAPPELNVQTFNGSEISLRRLAAMGVKFVFTAAKLNDVYSEEQVLGINIYRVSPPASHAEFLKPTKFNIFRSLSSMRNCAILRSTCNRCCCCRATCESARRAP